MKSSHEHVQRIISRLIVAAALVGIGVLVVGCCGGSSGPVCLGYVDANGKIYSPESGVRDRTQALKNACNGYCLEADPTCDAVYGIWLHSPAGQAAGSPPKKQALYQVDALMKCVTQTCANKCVADINSGLLKGGVSCAQR